MNLNGLICVIWKSCKIWQIITWRKELNLVKSDFEIEMWLTKCNGNIKFRISFLHPYSFLNLTRKLLNSLTIIIKYLHYNSLYSDESTPCCSTSLLTRSPAPAASQNGVKSCNSHNKFFIGHKNNFTSSSHIFVVFPSSSEESFGEPFALHAATPPVGSFRTGTLIQRSW